MNQNVPTMNVLNTYANLPTSKPVDAVIGNILGGLTFVFLIITLIFVVLYFITTLMVMYKELLHLMTELKKM